MLWKRPDHEPANSPPPFMAGVADVEVDLPDRTRQKVIDYYTAADCGTPVNPNLARVQAEAEPFRESEWH